MLEEQRRLSVRALGRELGLAGDELEELVEELVDVQQVARREGAVLHWVAAQEGGAGRHAVAGPGATPTLDGARKVVTVVFADLAGSTALHERIDPESARRLMESYYATLRAAIERHGGTVVKLLGDGVLAVFGVPQVAEDDAIRAVRAGVAMQEGLGALVAGQPTVLGAIGLRVAINTGEVVVSGANDDVVGDPVNVAARLQQEARNGDVVLGEATRRLVDADPPDAALARFEELAGTRREGGAEADAAPTRVAELERPAAPPRFANAATRAVDRGTAALTARDWEAFAALMAPGFRHYDRTRIAQLESDGKEWLAAFRPMVEMTSAPPAYRVLATRGERLALFEMLWRGAGGDVGPSEIDWRVIVEVNDRGQHVAIVVYDPDDLDAAYAELDARFEAEQGGRLPASRTAAPAIAKPNAAHAVMQRWVATCDHAVETGDWGPMREICAPHLVFDDRRRLALLSGGLDLMVASARERVRVGARPRFDLLGTAGDRIAIDRVLWSGSPADGRFEIEYLGLWEVDETGQVVAAILFDADEGLAVRREAWRRWAAFEPDVAAVARPMGELVDAFNAHDRDHWRAQLSDEIVVEDHRHAGMGRIGGADAYADTLVALWDLAPDTRVEAGWCWPALDRHGAITLVRRTGKLPDGGEFESEYLNLYTVSGGRIAHVELYEVKDLDRALARFQELSPRWSDTTPAP